MRKKAGAAVAHENAQSDKQTGFPRGDKHTNITALTSFDLSGHADCDTLRTALFMANIYRKLPCNPEFTK